MEKIEHRAVIKFFVKKGLTPTEIFNEIKNVLGDAGPLFTTVKKMAYWIYTWSCKFGRTGRPKSATIPEIINKLHDIVSDNRRLKMSEIAKTVGISDKGKSHSYWGIRYGKAVCKMGATFVDKWPKTDVNGSFSGIYGPFKEKSETFYW